MARKARGTGPKFVNYFVPLIEALRDLGGSARPAEVRQAIAAKLNLSDETLTETMQSGPFALTIKLPGRASTSPRLALLTHRVGVFGLLPKKGGSSMGSVGLMPLGSLRTSLRGFTGKKRMPTRMKTRKSLKHLQKEGQSHRPRLTRSLFWNA